MKKLLLILLLSVFGFYVAFSQSPAWVAPTSADGIKNPLIKNESILKEGKKLYKNLCAVCHGDFGKGDGIAGAALNPKPANFTTSKFTAQTDGAIYWKMTTGRAPMMNYKGIVEEMDIWKIITFVRSLEK